MAFLFEQSKKSPEKSCALFWDESFLWGLMAYRALVEAGLPFDLIRSQDIRAGELSHYSMIFVPGGWAQAKVRALGKKGQAEIRRFVENGGSYLGICGGAGLATDSHLGLLPVSRKPNADRVPSFSGPVSLALSNHSIWENIQDPLFYAWWPPELYAVDGSDFRILARYNEAGPDAYSADIRVADGRSAGWAALEKHYGIFLDPERLKGKPVVVEGICGKGKVILSLVHFDTPGEPNGIRVLQNLWRYFINDACPDGHFNSPPSLCAISAKDILLSDAYLNDMKAVVDSLIAEGERLLLWERRNDLLLKWRRGVRGMEYSTLAAMTKEITERLSRNRIAVSLPDASMLMDDLQNVRELLPTFAEDAKELLRLERTMSASPSSIRNNDTAARIKSLNLDLFGSARHFGGRFKPLIDAIDRLLFSLLKSV